MQTVPASTSSKPLRALQHLRQKLWPSLQMAGNLHWCEKLRVRNKAYVIIYSTFLAFTLSLLLYTFISFIASISYLSTLSRGDRDTIWSVTDMFTSMRYSPFIWVLQLYNFLALALACLLFGYHLFYIVAKGTSTKDTLKGDQNRVVNNPSDRHSFWANFENKIVNRKMPQALLKPREMVKFNNGK